MKLFRRIIAAVATLGAVIACVEEPEAVKVTGIEVVPSSLTLSVKDTYTLSAEVSPATATDKTVKWTSSDMSIAAVQDGQVQAISTGTAVITATANDGSGANGHCVVTVIAEGSGVKVTGVNVKPEKLSLTIGGKATLTAEVMPSDATNKSVIWKSTKESVATVKDGVVEGISAGDAIIIVNTVDGNHEASCKVTVSNEAAAADNIYFEYSEYRLHVGEELQLEVSTDPAGAAAPELDWKSSDSKIASVSSTGVVTAKKLGEAYVTATAKGNGKLVAETRILVAPDLSEVKELEFWTEEDWFLLDSDEEYTLGVFSEPEGIDISELNIEISDDESGMNSGKKPISLKRAEYWCYDVTPKVAGDCTVTVSTPDGKVSASCQIHVRKTPRSFSLPENELVLMLWQSYKVEGIFDPDPESTLPLMFDSAETNDIIAIDTDGIITAEGVGTIDFGVYPFGFPELAQPLRVIVIEDNGPEITDISFDHKAVYLHEGGEEVVTASIAPDDASPYSLAWFIDDPEVATIKVSRDNPLECTIIAKSVGKTRLLANTVYDNGAYAECEIVVAEPSDVESVSLPESRTMKKAGVIYLTATIKGKYKTIEWINYDPELIRVTPDKKDPKTAKIDAWNQDGIATVAILVDNYYVAYCEITIMN